MTPQEQLTSLCRSLPELEPLLKRLEKIAPIVLQQQREADTRAAKAYFDAKGEPDGVLLSITDWLAVDFRRIDTPEARELYSIGLAVAAFGGFDAIDALGWTLQARGCGDARVSIWNEWDGMAGYWK
jgi:hypothetical protein